MGYRAGIAYISAGVSELNGINATRTGVSDQGSGAACSDESIRREMENRDDTCRINFKIKNVID